MNDRAELGHEGHERRSVSAAARMPRVNMRKSVCDVTAVHDATRREAMCPSTASGAVSSRPSTAVEALPARPRPGRSPGCFPTPRLEKIRTAAGASDDPGRAVSHPGCSGNECYLF